MKPKCPHCNSEQDVGKWVMLEYEGSGVPYFMGENDKPTRKGFTEHVLGLNDRDTRDILERIIKNSSLTLSNYWYCFKCEKGFK